MANTSLADQFLRPSRPSTYPTGSVDAHTRRQQHRQSGLSENYIQDTRNQNNSRPTSTVYINDHYAANLSITRNQIVPNGPNLSVSLIPDTIDYATQVHHVPTQGPPVTTQTAYNSTELDYVTNKSGSATNAELSYDIGCQGYTGWMRQLEEAVYPKSAHSQGTAHRRNVAKIAIPFCGVTPLRNPNYLAPGATNFNAGSVYYAAHPLQLSSNMANFNSLEPPLVSNPHILTPHYLPSPNCEPEIPAATLVPAPRRVATKRSKRTKRTNENHGRPSGISKPDAAVIKRSNNSKCSHVSHLCHKVSGLVALNDDRSATPAPCALETNIANLESPKPSSTSVGHPRIPDPINSNTSEPSTVSYTDIFDEVTNHNRYPSDDYGMISFDTPNVPSVNDNLGPDALKPRTEPDSTSRPITDADPEEGPQSQNESQGQDDPHCTSQPIRDAGSEQVSQLQIEVRGQDDSNALSVGPGPRQRKKRTPKTSNDIQKRHSPRKPKKGPKYVYYCIDAACKLSLAQGSKAFKKREGIRRHLAAHNESPVVCPLPHKNREYHPPRRDHWRNHLKDYHHLDVNNPEIKEMIDSQEFPLPELIDGENCIITPVY